MAHGVLGEEMDVDSTCTLSVLWSEVTLASLPPVHQVEARVPSLLPLGPCHEKQNDNKNRGGGDTVKDYMLRPGNGNMDHTRVTRTWVTGRVRQRHRAREHRCIEPGLPTDPTGLNLSW